MSDLSLLATGPADLRADLPQPQVRTHLRGTSLWAALAAPALLAAFLGWAALTPINSAVISQGTVAVLGQNRKLQHLDGGIVAKVHARNGDRVEAGQVMLELDPTELMTTLEIGRSRLAEALALAARLQAEQDRSTGPLSPAFLPVGPALDRLGSAGSSADAIGTALAGQELIRTARAELRTAAQHQSVERVAQLREQIRGIDGLLAAKEEQLAFLDSELVDLQSLSDKGLVQRGRLLDTQRARADMQGQIAQHRTDRAGLANAIREAELASTQQDSEFREQISTDLRDTIGKIDELVQQIATAQAQLDRVVLRAPEAGIVHEMAVTSLGAVIAPGATVAEIVPVSEGIEFDLRLDPKLIDRVHPGQGARLTFPAFDRNRTPQIHGEIAAISPNTIEDKRTGTSYYSLRLSVPEAELARLGAPLVPGMPVEAYLETGERTALSWFMKPLNDHLGRAFREN